jgi:hypothetical protein
MDSQRDLEPESVADRSPSQIDVDAERPLDEDENGPELPSAVDVPLEAPIDDVVDQLRRAPLDDQDHDRGA